MKKDSLTYKFISLLIVVIILIIGINLLWDYYAQKRQNLNEMREKAQVITKLLDATWEFIAINQDRINYDSNGNFEFKKLNCSTVQMGVSVIFSETSDYNIKQTNISPRNALNVPDDYELSVLRQFVADKELNEYWSIEKIDDVYVFRYMRPLRIKDNCLPCHGDPKGEKDITGFPKEGLKVGDFGGAISIRMPVEMYSKNMNTNIEKNFSFFLILIIVFMFAIYFLVSRLVIKPLGELEKAISDVGNGNLEVDLNYLDAKGEIKQLGTHFMHMSNQLRDLYSNMEQNVEARTIELAQANEILKTKQQELVEANSKLNEVNTYKSEFLAIMSHELRTPLTSVVAFTEMLLFEIPNDRKTERHYIEEIGTNSQILLGLINNILDLAKIERGKTEIIIETMDMADVIASVEGVIMPIAKNKGLSFSVWIEPDVPLIKADPEKVRRIVENIVGNAVKFTKKNGEVDLIVSYDEEKKEVLIKVSDTGIGIEESGLQNIFEKFTQADSSISRKYQGTGLGLALTKELVDLHGGWIKVNSTLTIGSEFIVGLPTGEVD